MYIHVSGGLQLLNTRILPGSYFACRITVTRIEEHIYDALGGERRLKKMRIHWLAHLNWV